jgi:hypothetical protein
MMRTTVNAAAWVAKHQDAAERLKLRKAAAERGASAQEVSSSDPATRGSGPAEAVPGDAGLEVLGAGGSELGSTAMTQVTVEAAEARTSNHDVVRVDAEKLPQQDQPTEPAVEAEWGAVVPPPIVQAVVSVVEAPAPPQGSTPALIDLTADDSPTNRGKQEVDVEMDEALDRAGTSVELGGD